MVAARRLSSRLHRHILYNHTFDGERLLSARRHAPISSRLKLDDALDILDAAFSDMMAPCPSYRVQTWHQRRSNRGVTPLSMACPADDRDYRVIGLEIHK